jgi:nucleotide-binding universal stress UspA family protein
MDVLEGFGTPQRRTRLALDNILFATDFSPASEVGLRYALALARHYHGNIYMVPAVAVDPVEAISNDAQQKAVADARTRAIGWVAELRLSGRLDGVRHKMPVGEAAEKALPWLLENRKLDLAVNGAGCREGQTLLLEPTVEKTIWRSECAVVTIGSQFHETADGELKNIVYATDFSPESLEGARYALSLAQEFQARLTLLHVVEGAEPALLDERAQIAKPYKLAQCAGCEPR